MGASYGTQDGTNAKAQAGLRDYPTDVPILCAVDTNTTATNVVKQEAYVRAFAVAAAPYPIGIYGDTDILGRCAGLWQIGWLPSAWSWSGTSRAQAEAKAKALGAHVLQYTGFYIDQIWAVDPNVAINDFPAWGLTPDPPIPPGGDDDMLRLLAPIDSPARFYATCTPEGAALRCEWTGDGTLPKVDARLDLLSQRPPCRHGPIRDGAHRRRPDQRQPSMVRCRRGSPRHSSPTPTRSSPARRSVPSMSPLEPLSPPWTPKSVAVRGRQQRPGLHRDWR